ncbi:MAG: Ig-like domain-containing protein [Candidatus Eisenbacteria bacterium]
MTPFDRPQRIARLGAAAFVTLLLLFACGKHESPTNGGTPPSVVIHSPGAGDTLSGIGFTVTGIASDEEGIAAIRLKADGMTFATTTASPFSLYFPAFLFDAGAIDILVEAEDTDGAKGSASVGATLAERALRSIGSAADQEREPAFSPDGNTIVFTSEGTSGNRDLYTVSASGGAAALLASSSVEDISPDWSPNGLWIAFASNRSANWDVWTVPAGGGAETRISTSGAADRGPVWSPNGARIAFHSNRDGNWNLYAVLVSNGEPSGAEEAYTAAATVESSATWRSDGDVLAFVSNQVGGSDLSTVQPPGPILTLVPGANDPMAREIDPAFCPKGPYLVFADNRNGQYDIWAVDPASGRKKILASHIADDREPAWSPRGNRIAFASNRGGTYDIWILE